MGGNQAFYAKYWDAKRAVRADLRSRQLCRITQVGQRVQVVTPYDKEFSKFAAQLRARWRPRSSVWSFAAKDKGLVVNMIIKLWGEASLR